MTPMYDHPIAVLMALDGSERVMRITEPPRPVYLVPRPTAFVVTRQETPCMTLPNHRVFKLSRLRSGVYRFWRVYNEGRTQTPEDGYIYFERQEGSEP